jgi:hypothetical protein
MMGLGATEWTSRVEYVDAWKSFVDRGVEFVDRGVLIAMIGLELQREMILLMSENETKGLLHLTSLISYDTYCSPAYSRRQGEDNIRC